MWRAGQQALKKYTLIFICLKHKTFPLHSLQCINLRRNFHSGIEQARDLGCTQIIQITASVCVWLEPAYWSLLINPVHPSSAKPLRAGILKEASLPGQLAIVVMNASPWMAVSFRINPAETKAFESTVLYPICSVTVLVLVLFLT